MVSIIIPTYNEERCIFRALERLSCVRGNFEIVVVDGQSTDATTALVEGLRTGFPKPLRYLTSVRNRGTQLAHGADSAHGDAFLFLHADTLLPHEAIEVLEARLREDSIVGGNFHLVYQGSSAWNGIFTWINRQRRCLGIYYGDSGLFVRREVFQRLGGFKPMPIMEDYEFVQRLEKSGRTVSLSPALTVSDRRWRTQGAFRTILSWALIQALYSLGIPADRLAKWYKPVRH